jgi:hypothetical protein
LTSVDGDASESKSNSTSNLGRTDDGRDKVGVKELSSITGAKRTRLTAFFISGFEIFVGIS